MLRILTAFLLLLFTSDAATPPPAAAVPPPAAIPADAADYLAAHNRARSDLGVAPLVWSPNLAKTAGLTVRLQRDKQNCSFADMSNSMYGANQLWTGGFTPPPRMVVDSWIAEKAYYTYENNSCAANRHCGVYTQVVWRKTTELGCAQGVCSNARSSLTICLYNPPGNVVGEKPY